MLFDFRVDTLPLLHISAAIGVYACALSMMLLNTTDAHSVFDNLTRKISIYANDTVCRRSLFILLKHFFLEMESRTFDDLLMSKLL